MLPKPNGLKPPVLGAELGCPKAPKTVVLEAELAIADDWPKMFVEDGAAETDEAGWPNIEDPEEELGTCPKRLVPDEKETAPNGKDEELVDTDANVETPNMVADVATGG